MRPVESRPRAITTAAVVLALALAPALAGCLAVPGTSGGPDPAALSAPVFDTILAAATPFTASDGVVLDLWTFRPDVPEGVKVPVILTDSPYFGNSDPPTAERGQPFSQWLVDFFVPRGYAVVLKSVRGTGASGGCFGMGDPREALDGAEVVEALAAEPWSDGNVAMIGKSYRGTTPIQTAVLAPPALKTIVPIAGITEWYLYVVSPGGVHYKDWVAFNTGYQVYVGFNSNSPTEDPGRTPAYAEKVCPTVAELAVTEAHSTATGEYNSGWEMRNYAKDVDKMTASVYLVHGFQDFNVKPDQIAPWFETVKTPKKALLGQWPHEYPYRADWGEHLLAWFDHELKGVANGALDGPAVIVEDSAGAWRFEDSWPPRRATVLDLVPTAAGGLAAESAEGATVSIVGNPTWVPDASAGTNEWQFVAATGPLAEGLRVAGIPELVFEAAIDRPQATFAATLYDVAPDGEMRAINWAFLDTRHRESVRTSEPMAPVVERATMTLRFFPMDHHVEPGHGVAFALAGQDPRWIVGQSPGATLSVSVGDGAALRLPVVPDATLESPQPVVREFEELPWYGAKA